MTKARLRIIVALSVIGLLIGMGILVGRFMWQQGKAELAGRALDLLPDVAQRIQNFHRVQVRDGRKVWEIAATEARYFEEEHRVVVRDPVLRLYLPDGRAVGVRGDEGTVSLEGKELRSVELSGGIEVTLTDYTVTTDYARYDRSTDRIIAPGMVHISGQDVDARGERMEVDVGAQRLRLSSDVHMTLRKRERSSGAS